MDDSKLQLPPGYSLGLFPDYPGGRATIRYNNEPIGYVVRMGGNDKYMYCARMGRHGYGLFRDIRKRDYSPDLYDAVYKCIVKHRLGV